MRKIQIGIGLLLLACLAAFLVSAFSGEGEPEVRPMTSADCAACHVKIAEEVASSWHGRAFKDPDVLDLSKNFQDEQCISCHAPVPIYRVGPGERVLARREDRELGIDCISCHLMPDGTVAGKRGLDAPCRPVKEPTLGTATFCAGCHNQHWTVDEYAASRWIETHTCNDCHMRKVDRPLVEGGPIRKGVATHIFEGGHYLWMLEKAATLAAECADGKLEIRVTNSGTGHKMPTDARHRSFNVLLTVRDREGNLLVDRKEVAEYRLYYRDMKKDSTQLAPFETRRHVVDLPSGKRGTARVELVYCLKPPQKLDRSWTVVKSVEVDF